MSVQSVFQLNHEGCERVFSEQFEELIKQEKNDEVKSIVSLNSSSNIVDSYGETLLHLAAKYNNIELINFSLNLGCDINAKNILGATPLLTALSNNHFEAVTVLLARNAHFCIDAEHSVNVTAISGEPLFTLSGSRMSLEKVFQFNLEGCERIFNEDFEELIKDRRNEEVKSILRYVSSPNIVDSYGETLLHLAAKYNNPDIINFLSSLGCQIDAKNILGVTPFSTAVSNNHFEAVAVLLTHNADFRIDDTESIVRVLLTKKDAATSSITSAFMQTLRKHCVDLTTMAGVLVKANCPLKFVLRVRDVQLTRTILEMEDFTISDEQSLIALQYAMKSVDLENLRLLWQSPHTIASRRRLLRQLHYWITGSPLEWRFVKNLFLQLTDWITFDSDLTWFLEMIFRQSSKRVLEVLLLECDVDVQMKEKHDFDLLPCIFGNLHQDLTGLALKRRFDVNSKSINGMTALHFASIIESHNNVRLLLDLGADCNAKDDLGYVPITHIHGIQCAELLLQHGTDLQIDDNKGITIIEKLDYFTDTWELMLAQLAIDDCRGVLIQQRNLRKIHSKATYKVFYEQCLKQIADILTYEVFPSLTLFRLLTEKVEDIPHCIRNEDTIEMIMEYCQEQSLHSYYCSSLKWNLEKVLNVFRSKCRAAEIISGIVDNQIGFDHLVVDKIFQFLNYKDMLGFLEM